VFLRESLISFIVNRISGGSDIAETVNQLSNVLQREPKILDTMDEHGKDNERLNLYEMGRLLEFLKTLELS
jgi:hypothetical protein